MSLSRSYTEEGPEMILVELNFNSKSFKMLCCCDGILLPHFAQKKTMKHPIQVAL